MLQYAVTDKQEGGKMNATNESEITTTEAAALTGYSKGHIRWLARKEKIEYRRVGLRVILIDKASLLAHVEKMKELGPQKHDPH